MGKADAERVQRIEDLVNALENIPDRESRATAKALMEAILELHGAGLDRILEIVFDTGEFGKTAIRRLAGDSLVASLLVLHGLHPDDLQTRVQQALTKAKVPAELLGVFDGVVRVRLTEAGCGLKESAEAVLREAAPDAEGILVSESGPSADFVPLSSLGLAVSRIA